MRALRAAIGTVGVIGLVGCAVTPDLHGSFQKTGEAFTGSVVMGADGSGSLTLSSPKGLSCAGTFVSIDLKSATGSLTCTDGRVGTFALGPILNNGRGWGKIEGESFTFSLD